jgi:hypothetical protein
MRSRRVVSALLTRDAEFEDRPALIDSRRLRGVA